MAFGPEDTGLRNEELSMCDMASTIPMHRSYPSLNLGQAVMLFAYELSALAGVRAARSAAKTTTPAGEYRTMKNAAERFMRDVGMEPRSSAYRRVLERLALLAAKDVHLVLSVLQRALHRHNPVLF